VRRLAGLRDDLRDAVSVAEIDERQSAEVPPAVDPSGERDLCSSRDRRELAAGVRSLHRCPF